jgi:hypothetical protein
VPADGAADGAPRLPIETPMPTPVHAPTPALCRCALMPAPAVRERTTFLAASRFVACLALLAAAVAAPAGAHPPEPPEANTLVPAGTLVYPPGAMPDRVLLLPGADAAREATVTWRTVADDVRPLLEIGVASDGPALAEAARRVAGTSTPLVTDNGRAAHHAVRLQRLRPDTLYAYRVRGQRTWSEWFQFRTAPAASSQQPWRFIYLGDAQNRIRSQVSRVVRQAWGDAPRARLLIHAGDLVNSRAGRHDDEWGEWFHAGGFPLAMVPSLPAAGNHEYVKDGDGAYAGLAPHWPAQMAVPANGAGGVESTTYFVDLGGVRFVVLDTLSALEYGSAAAQARWLARVLAGHGQRWTVVIQHHPMHSLSQGRDNPLLREHWQPLYERHGVDLVLQGHDHAYGRGGNVGEGTRAADPGHGTAYVVSVAGPKQYLLDAAARAGVDRAAEDTQLYQLIDVEPGRLRYQARTAAGRLYDAFDLERRADGGVRVVERPDGRIGERRCRDPETPERCRTG